MIKPQSAWRNRIEYLGVAVGYVLLAKTPLVVAVAIAKVLADIWRLVDKRHRRRVVEQSMACLAIDRRRAERLAKDNYRHYVFVILEIMRLSGMTLDEAVLRMDLRECEGIIKSAMGEGRGMVVATGHLGNWEWGCLAFGHLGAADGVIARPLENPLIDAAVNRNRVKAGVEVWYKAGAIRKAMAALKRRRAFAAVIDQDGGYHGVMAPFFGREASTMPMPVELAMRTCSPILVGALVRDGYPMRFKARCRRLHRPRPGTEKEAELRRLLTDINADLCDIIREFPEQWMWLLNRWKSDKVKPRTSSPTESEPRQDGEQEA